MIKNVEIEMYGHKWLIEIDRHGPDRLDFDIVKTELNHNGVTLDMSDLCDSVKDFEIYATWTVAVSLDQEALNNV